MQTYAARPVRPLVPATIGTWSCDLETEKLRWCGGVRTIFGLPSGAAPDRATSLQCYEPASRLRLEVLRGATIRSGRPFTLDAQLTSVSGEPRWIRIVAAVESGPTVRPRLYGVKQDITAERISLETARLQPDHDALTGLPGAAIFDDALMAAPRIANSRAVLILVELAVTDPRMPSADHRNTLLLEGARRLEKAFPTGGLVARTDDHRFSILLERRLEPPALDTLLLNLWMALKRPVSADGIWVRGDVAIGAAIDRSAEWRDPVGLRARAEMALAETLAAGGGRPRIAGFVSTADTGDTMTL